MKVYIVTKEPFPIGMAATNRILCLAKAFISAGVDCIVIVFSRTYKDNSIPGIGIFEDVPYEYIGGSSQRPNIKWVARLQSLWLRVALLCYLKKKIQSGDVVYDFIGGSNCLKDKIIGIVHRKGAFCVRELNEYPFGTGKETKKTAQQREYAFKHLFPRYDGIIAISDALIDVAKKYCSSRCVIQKIPILVDFEKFNIQDKSSLVPIPYIFHAGTLYEKKDGILGMIEAFGMARQRLQIPIKYIMTGHIDASPQAKDIRQLISKFKLGDSIEFVGYLNREQIKDYLSKASLVISNRQKSQQDYYGFSTKVGEYLAAGKPLITTNWGEAAKWLNHEENSYIIEPEDTNALTDMIVHVFENQEEAIAIGKSGRELCHNCFDYQVWSNILNAFLMKL